MRKLIIVFVKIVTVQAAFHFGKTDTTSSPEVGALSSPTAVKDGVGLKSGGLYDVIGFNTTGVGLRTNQRRISNSVDHQHRSVTVDDSRQRGQKAEQKGPNSGSYCCVGRNDQCWRPFFDTVCYYDEFCLQRASVDCCPHVWNDCLAARNLHYRMKRTLHSIENAGENLHASDIKVCIDDYGNTRSQGEEIRMNCNRCICHESSDASGDVRRMVWNCTKETCAVRLDLLDRIRDGNLKIGWTAANHSLFWGITMADVVNRMLSTVAPTSLSPIVTSIASERRVVELPVEYDARQWCPVGIIEPNTSSKLACDESLFRSTAAVIISRLAISGLLVNETAFASAVQQLTRCISQNYANKSFLQQQQTHSERTVMCHKANVEDVWKSIHGLQLIREYNLNVSTEGSSSQQQQQQQQNVCFLDLPLSRRENGENNEKQARQIQSQIFRVSDSYRVAPMEQEIMREIMINGPVQAIMEVKDDFILYDSGIYSRSLPAEYLPLVDRSNRFHSVNIVGWGLSTSQLPVKYWTCANSWSSSWGENGYFRIVRGSDESRIESFVYSALATEIDIVAVTA